MAKVQTRTLEEKIAAAFWMHMFRTGQFPATEKSFYRRGAEMRNIKIQDAKDFIKIAESIGIKIELKDQ